MRKRHKMKKSHSKHLFEKTAQRTRAKNLQATPMRGGFRI